MNPEQAFDDTAETGAEEPSAEVVKLAAVDGEQVREPDAPNTLDSAELEQHDNFLRRTRNALGGVAAMGAVGTAYFGIAEQSFEQTQRSFTLTLAMVAAAGSAEMLRQIHSDSE